MGEREVVYVDMDGVLVDFASGLARVQPGLLAEYQGREDEIPGVFALMDPIPGAVTGFQQLANTYDTYILSTPSWHNPSSWSDKLLWVHDHLGSQEGTPAYKRLILSHNKHLNAGSILIDDRLHNGADRFDGQLIRFGSREYPDWSAVLHRLL